MTRSFYPACEVAVEAFADAAAFACEDAEVWIEGDVMLVSYFDDEGPVVFEGRAAPDRSGWQLGARSRPWQASLAADPPGPARRAPSVPTLFRGVIETPEGRASWSLKLIPADSADG